MPLLDDVAHWVASWSWESGAPTLISALLAVGVAVGLSRSERRAASAQRVNEAAEAQKLRDLDAAQRARDRRRDLVAAVLVELGAMLGVASTANSKSESRVSAASFQLRASALRLEAAAPEQENFELWALHVHEAYLGNDDNAYSLGGRQVIDHARPVIALATEQLIQWERGEASSAELLLLGAEATDRFFGAPRRT